jgi:hypothetical protein
LAVLQRRLLASFLSVSSNFKSFKKVDKIALRGAKKSYMVVNSGDTNLSFILKQKAKMEKMSQTKRK